MSAAVHQSLALGCACNAQTSGLASLAGLPLLLPRFLRQGDSVEDKTDSPHPPG
jgi:hypothetical protein